VTFSKDEKKKEVKKAPKKVYMIIDNKKYYIDPEMVKKYDLEKAKVSPLTGRKLYVEKD
jgi:hypothetical protein